MLWILEAKVVGDLCDTAALIHEHLLAEGKHMLLDKQLRAHTRFLSHKVAKISR